MRRPLVLAPALILLACSGAAGEPPVRAYDAESIRAYRTGDVSRLHQVATAAELRRLAALIDLKTAAGLALESKLERLEVTGSERAGGSELRVRTREEWRYGDRAVRPGASPGPLIHAEMEMEYRLVLGSGQWKVDRVRTLSNRYLDPPDGGGP